MTPLTQQLEDKKKEYKELYNSNHNNFPNSNICRTCAKMNRCQAEIAILEQAIAEIRNIQSQQNKTTKDNRFSKSDEDYPASAEGLDSRTNSADISNLQFPELEPKKCFSDGFDKGVQFGIQKQRQEFERVLNRIIGKIQDSRNNGEMIIDYCKKIKQQLNQPKEEQ